MSSRGTLYSHSQRFKPASIGHKPSRRNDQKRRRIMKLPGPDHPITITPNAKRVRVTADGVVIAETTHALTLKEASYPAVQYFPRHDAKMDLLKRTERVTHCPYK